MALGSPAFPSTTTKKGTGPSPVTSVFTRNGDVLPVGGDYTGSQITNVPAGNVVATEQQAAINELDTEKVAKAGDSMAAAANLTFSSGGEPKGLPLVPGGDDSGVSKAFVNSVLDGLDVKGSCRIASDPNANWTGTATADFVTGTGVLTISALTAGSSRGLIDGIEPIDENRILLKDLATLSGVTTDSGAEATPKKYNGLWEVTGGSATTLTLERTQDADADAEVTSGLFTFIEEGTQLGNGFVITTPDPIVVDTTAITFSQFSSPGGGVVSFNTRTGVVNPETGDYTPTQVSLGPTANVNFSSLTLTKTVTGIQTVRTDKNLSKAAADGLRQDSNFNNDTDAEITYNRRDVQIADPTTDAEIGEIREYTEDGEGTLREIYRRLGSVHQWKGEEVPQGSGTQGTTWADDGPQNMALWYAAKSAFRAGEVTTDITKSDGFDEANIGRFGGGFGLNNKLSADYGFVFGRRCIVSDNWSFAGGDDCEANGEHSFAFGSNSRAALGASLAVGWGARADHLGSLVFAGASFSPIFGIGSILASTANNQVIFAAEGGLGIGRAPVAKLDVDGSVALKRRAVAVSGNTDADDYQIGVTDTSSPRTITIRTADIIARRIFRISDESGNAGTNNITIATEGAQKINGVNTWVIDLDYGSARLYSDGTNLFTKPPVNVTAASLGLGTTDNVHFANVEGDIFHSFKGIKTVADLDSEDIVLFASLSDGMYIATLFDTTNELIYSSQILFYTNSKADFNRDVLAQSSPEKGRFNINLTGIQIVNLDSVSHTYQWGLLKVS